VNIDGGSRGNPGKAAAAMVVTDENGRILITKSKFLGADKTNNFAEWSALAGAVRALSALTQKHGQIEAEVRSDSELVVRQFNKVYKIKSAELRQIAQETWANLEENRCLKLTLTHVPREKNKLADAAVNRELDRYK
jgi:ribonuclease HI